MNHIFLIILIAISFGRLSTVIASPLAEIPAGPFISGNNSEPAQTATLGTFFIDTYEVTNAEYAEKFLHIYPADAGLHPVTGITWGEAQTFCEKSGKRLPTESEWEKAARGTDGRIYPWGNNTPKEKPHPYFSGLIKRRVGLQKQDTSPYGVSDMAGSVWEWTQGKSGEKKVARGGLWNLHLDYEYSKTYDRNFVDADQRFPFLGFRCAQ